MRKKRIFRRPLFAVACAFFAAGVLAVGVENQVVVAAFVAVTIFTLSATVFCAVTKHRVTRAALIILIPITLSTLIQIFAVNREISNAERYDDVVGDAVITITDVCCSSSYYGYYTAQITKSDTFPCLKITLGYPDGSCREGDVLSGDITLHTLAQSSSFDERAYYIPDGIFMSADAEKLEYVGRDTSFSPTKSLSRLNRKLCARIEAASGDGSLAQAILLGRRDSLEASVKRDFSRIGISHLLALSGIHLSVIVGMADALLSKSRLPRRVTLIVEAFGIIFFMALVGFSRSVTRAGVMQLIRITAQLIGRRSDPKTNLGTAVLIIMLVDPLAVRDTAFVLSVLAAYACIAYSEYKRLNRIKSGKTIISRILCGTRDTVLMTLLISALTLPVMWKVFGQISLISPLTNVVFIPVIGAYLYFSLIYVVLCRAPVIGPLLTFILTNVERIICAAARKLSLLPHITLSLHGNVVGVLSFLLFIAVFAATLQNRKKRVFSARFDKSLISRLSVVACTIALVCAVSLGLVTNAQSAAAVYVTQGKSEGFSLRYKNDFVLIDISDGSSGFSRPLLAEAESCGADEISCLVLTHLHRRHIASLSTLAERAVLRHVCIPEAESEDDEAIFASLVALFERDDIPYSVYSRENSLVDIGGICFESLALGKLSRSSHPVICFSITVANERLLYLGSSFEDLALRDDDLSLDDADTVFFGAHHPKRKSEVALNTHGTAVIAYGAATDELLSVTAAETVPLLENGKYETKKLPLENK